MSEKNKSGNFVAIATMFALYGMVAFVTNLAAPLGTIWKAQPGIDGSNTLGMMGNMMNFLAYLFMGIPAGKMITKIGYKKTACTAIACGFVGVLVQFLSGKIGGGSVMVPFTVYLLGAFICGFAVCMLNTVVNPMLNTLGGGGNRGNQLNTIGCTFNSLTGTATPLFVGALIGEVTKDTRLADVNLVMYIALAVFALSFAIVSMLPIANPEGSSSNEEIPLFAPLKFRHCLLGVIGIFFYVGIEVGIPGTMMFWLGDPNGDFAKELAKIDPNAKAMAIAGSVAGTYWFLMLCGRIVGSFIGGKVSSRLQMTVTTLGAIILLAIGTQTTAIMTKMPVFTGSSFTVVPVPLTALLFALCGACTSIMWPSTFNLAVEKLGKYTAVASGLFMAMVVGGGVLPLVQGFVADKAGFMLSYIVPILGLAYLFVYSAFLSKPADDIKVD